MTTVERFENGAEINKEIAFTELIGKTEFAGEAGKYILEFTQNDFDDIQITVIQISDTMGANNLFNEQYNENFSFGEFLADLHDQHLEEIEELVYDYIIEKARVKKWKLDTGNDGCDEILTGDSYSEVEKDVLYHHELEILPDHWSITEIDWEI